MATITGSLNTLMRTQNIPIDKLCDLNGFPLRDHEGKVVGIIIDIDLEHMVYFADTIY